MQITDLARSLGISRQMVYKLRDKGMPTDNMEVAIAWRKSNVDPFRSKSGRIGGNSGAKYQPAKVNSKVNENESDIGDMMQQVSGSQLDLETDDADILFKNARALKEKAMALQSTAEHEIFIGSLVERAIVEKIIFERARQFRDGTMAVSRRLAPLIIGKESVREVEDLINTEIRQMLYDFTRLPVIE